MSFEEIILPCTSKYLVMLRGREGGGCPRPHCNDNTLNGTTLNGTTLGDTTLGDTAAPFMTTLRGVSRRR